LNFDAPLVGGQPRLIILGISNEPWQGAFVQLMEFIPSSSFARTVPRNLGDSRVNALPSTLIIV
jgi:hypothetical protein